MSQPHNVTTIVTTTVATSQRCAVATSQRDQRIRCYGFSAATWSSNVLIGEVIFRETRNVLSTSKPRPNTDVIWGCIAPDSRNTVINSKLKLMPKREKLVGRPPKEIEAKLCKSINLKLTIGDYCTLIDRAEKLNMTPTAYARQLVVSGKVVSPFSAEELQLLRALAGEANNINQIAKHLNSGAMQYKLTACAIIMKIQKILDDSKKH